MPVLTSTHKLAWRSLLLASSSLLAAACVVGEPGVDELYGDRGDPRAITRWGSADTLDIATWNVEWFGSTFKGPSDEGLQIDNVRDVILGSDMDIWGVEEITENSAFVELLDNLPGYSAIVANDPIVEEGSAYYYSTEQKVALIYKEDAVEVERARIILTGSNYDFAGRPPLEVTMNVTLGGETQKLVVIVLHAKAMTDSKSYNRRLRASEALHAYLDQTHPSEAVIVLGDFNDDIDTSISSGRVSPYENFVLDDTGYTFPTKALSDAGLSSTVRYRDVIDHHLVTDELYARYIADSVDVLSGLLVEISDYDDTTSDHYPVATRYTWGEPVTGGEPKVLINEVLANEPGSSTELEFVELVNTGDGAADLSGWVISDAIDDRHVFAADTILGPGQAIVVFGGEAGIPAGLESAVAASRGALSLNNGGDSVTLTGADGQLVDQVSYDASLAVDGVSMNRGVDGDDTAAFVLHDSISTAASSPGTRTDGSSFQL